MMYSIYNAKTACAVFQPEDISCYEMSNVKQTLVRKCPFVSKNFANVSKGSQTASTSSSSVYSSFSSLLSVTSWYSSPGTCSAHGSKMLSTATHSLNITATFHLIVSWCTTLSLKSTTIIFTQNYPNNHNFENNALLLAQFGSNLWGTFTSKKFRHLISRTRISSRKCH